MRKELRIRLRIAAADKAALMAMPYPMATTVAIGLQLLATSDRYITPTEGKLDIPAEMRVSGTALEQLKAIAAKHGMTRSEATRAAIATAIFLYQSAWGDSDAA